MESTVKDTITTACTCTYEDDNGNETESSECFGCYEFDIDNLNYDLTEWAKANGYEDETLIRIEATGLGWERRAGYKDVKVEEIDKALFINGEFTITYEFSADYKTLTAVRYSHDEPTGTGEMTFTKSPLDYCARCGEVDTCREIDGEQFCPVCEQLETE